MSEHKENIFYKAWDYLIEAVAGFSLSGFMASFWPEVIHGIAVVITGIVSTLAIDFLRKKYIPLKDKYGYWIAFKLLFKKTK